jgi:Surface antigen variable number repeat
MVRKAVPLGLLAVVCSILTPAPCPAQSPPPPKFCFPPPIATVEEAPYRKVIVDHVEFDKPVRLSSAEIEPLIADANRIEYNAESDAWVDEFAEIELRGAWQNRGYFKIALSARAKSLGADSESERFVVLVHIENEGPQYHVGIIQFAGGTAFQEWELRNALPFHEGEIFDVESIRKAVEELTKLYGRQGYIDFTVVPDTVVDDNLQRISVVMRLNEQKQFRVGKVEIESLDTTLAARVRSLVIPGNIFDDRALVEFAKQNQMTLPPRFLDRMEARRNVRVGIVDVSFDLRLCPDANPRHSAALSPEATSP